MRGDQCVIFTNNGTAGMFDVTRYLLFAVGGYLLGVGATIADRETSEEVEACTGLARQARRVCLAEGALGSRIFVRWHDDCCLDESCNIYTILNV